MTDCTLTIDALHCRINLPEGGAPVAATRDRLARIAQEQLAPACSAILTDLPDDRNAIYRIRHLHLDLWVDLQTMSEAEIARRWGALLALAMTRAIQRSDSPTVRRFASPARFVSSFLADLLDGRAWGCWYYQEFRPLERLTAEAIALQLLTLRPQWAISVLADLAATGHVERLITRWDARDHDQLWAALELPAQSALAAPIDPVLRDIWQRVALQEGESRVDRSRDRLRLWLAAIVAAPGEPTSGVLSAMADAACALVDLAALVRRFPGIGPTLAMQSGLYPPLLERIAASPLADTLLWLLPLSQRDPQREHLAALMALVAARYTPQASSSNPPSSAGSSTEAIAIGQAPEVTESAVTPGLLPAALSSPVGSIFLLVPSLVASGYWQRWEEADGEVMARRYLFLVALKALGQSRAPLLLGDRILAAFAGLSQPPIADARLTPAIDPLAAGMALPAWIAALPVVVDRWYPARDRQLQIGNVGDLHVLQDGASQYWLAAFPAAPDHPCWQSFPRDRAHPIPSDTGRSILVAEANHLQSGSRLGYPWLTPTLDAALSAVTSLVMRHTAARFPGFHRASLPYLAQQFLAQPATLQSEAEALQVDLSGGPLAMVVRMADLPDTIAVPWLPHPLRFTQSGRRSLP